VKKRGREKRGGEETERRNVDSIHRAQVEMVAHKYSYEIPEARKTSIPVEAYVCPLLPLRVHSVILRLANGKAPSNGREKCWHYDFSARILRGVALCENVNFPTRIFNAFYGLFFLSYSFPPRSTVKI